MNSRKLRVLALLLSAVMILTAVPSTLFAEDFSDGEVTTWDDNAVVADDALVTDDLGVADDFGFEGADDFVAAADDIADSVTIANVQFYYNHATHDDYDVTYDLVYIDGVNKGEVYRSYDLDKAATDLENSHVDATCEEYGTFRMKVSIPEWPNPNREDKCWISEDLRIAAEPPLHHSWTIQKIVDHTDATCETDGASKYDWVCDRKGCGKTFTAYYANPALPLTNAEKELYAHLNQVHLAVNHDYKDEVYYLDTDADGEPVAPLLTKEPKSDLYYKITAKVCQNIKNAKVKICEAPVQSVKIERMPNNATVDISGLVNIASEDDYKGDTKAFENFVFAEDIEGTNLVYPYTFKLEDIVLIDCAKEGSFVLKFNHYNNFATYTLKNGDYTKDFEITVIDENLTDEDEIEANDKAAGETVDKLIELIGLIKPDANTTEKVVVPAHHSLEYMYTMTDKKLIGTVDDYIIFEKDGKIYNNDTVKVAGDRFVAAELLSIKASRYCVPFSVDVESYCICAKHPSNARTGKRVNVEPVEAKATEGAHLIDEKTVVALNAIKGGTDLNTYEKFIKDYSKYVKELSNTATCTKLGTAEVQFICTLCGKDANKATIKIDKFTDKANSNSHKYESKRENVVEPTCSATGSFMSVQICSRCNDKKEIGTVYLKKTPHKYSKTPVATWVGDVVVDESAESLLEMKGEVISGYTYDNNGKLFAEWDTYKSEWDTYKLGTPNDGWTNSNYSVYPVLAVVCEVCGHKEPLAGNFSVTIDDIKKEGRFCEQGEITLTAKVNSSATPVTVDNNDYPYPYNNVAVSTDYQTISAAFPYYSSMSAYQGRTAHSYGDPVTENVVAPTETAPGSHDIVVYCRICGLESYRRTLVDPPVTHTHTLEKVDAKAATCTEAGNIEYYVCKGENCGAFFSDSEGKTQITKEETVIAALGHKLEKVEAKEATCAAGNIEHYKCSVCGKLFKDEAGTNELIADQTVIAPVKEHTPAEAVIEKRDGVDYSVVKCSVCGVEISAKPIEATVTPTPSVPATMPAQVTGEKVTKNSPTKRTIGVSYKAVEGADQYTVNYRAAGTTAWTKNLTDGADTNFELTGLTRGTAYDIRIAAIANGIAGQRSGHLYRWLEKVTLEKPVRVKGDTRSVTVSWNDVGATKYKVYYSQDKAFKTGVKTGIVTGTSAKVTELVPGKYYFKVRCYKTIGGITYTGAWSNVKSKTIK